VSGAALEEQLVLFRNIFAFNCRETAKGNVTRCFDPNPDLISTNLHDGNFNVVGDENSTADLP
jgi:hypothetical protein